MRLTHPLLSLLFASCLLTFIGCGPGSKPADPATETNAADDQGDADGHQHADNYDDAVAELQELSDQIRTGFEQDDVDAAHGPLHEVGHVLENIDGFVKSSELSDEVKKPLTEAVETLFDSYGAIDDKQHGLEGKDFKDVSGQIDTAMQVLTDQLGKIDGTFQPTEATGPSVPPGEVPEVREVTE
jgi:hypothetical protein